MTRRLGLEPDSAVEKGTEVPRPSGRIRVQRTGVWRISSEGRLDTTSSERHLLFLLERVEPRADELAALVAEQGLAADFFCLWASASAHGGPYVSADTLGRIARLGAALGYDFYDRSPE